jgi:hypothetical protein
VKDSPKQNLLHVLVIASVLSCGSLLGGCLLAGCGKDSNGVNPADRLCRGQSGFAARITGTPTPVEMCVSDQLTIANYIPDAAGDKYEISASFTTDSLTVDIEISFFVQPSFPRTLTLTADQGLADADPSAAWFFYHEIKQETYEYISSFVTGTFTVTFNDASVATATFSGVEVELDDASSGDPAGARSISEGYVSVNAD